MAARRGRENEMPVSRFIQQDREAEGCSEAITEYVSSLSDSEGLQHALANDDTLLTLTCTLMNWVTDPMVGAELRSKNMLDIANRIERHARQFAERRFNEGARAVNGKSATMDEVRTALAGVA